MKKNIIGNVSPLDQFTINNQEQYRLNILNFDIYKPIYNNIAKPEVYKRMANFCFN